MASDIAREVQRREIGMRGYRGRGVHGALVERIGQMIISGVYAEGQVLDLTAMESELDISRTALREAFKVLRAKGLVDARPKRGTFVRSREEWQLLDPDVIRWAFVGTASSVQMLDDLNELRSIVEPAAARLAALRRTSTDLDRLERALEQMQLGYEQGDPVEADVLFHRALLAATHNELLGRMDVGLDVGLAERGRLVHDVLVGDNPTPSHRLVFAAIAERDPEAAAAATHALLDKSRADIEKARSMRATAPTVDHHQVSDQPPALRGAK